jgi:formylmethanofuran dehydrogenase subunit E
MFEKTGAPKTAKVLDKDLHNYKMCGFLCAGIFMGIDAAEQA